MANLLVKYKKISALGLGALSTLAFAPYWQMWAGWMAFAGLVYLLYETNKWKDGFKLGYCFGLAHFSLGLAWVGNALLIDIGRFGWLYPIVVIAAGVFFGLFAAIPAGLAELGKGRYGKWLVFSATWVLSEWLRSFFLSGFPWNLWGYSWSFGLPLIQNAAIGGVYLTSLLAVLSYGVWGIFLYERRYKTLFEVMAIAILIVGSAWGWGVWRLNNGKTEITDTVIRIVQPSIAQDMKWSRALAENHFLTYLELSRQDSEVKPDWIIWGETASPFRLDEDEVHRQLAIKNMAEDNLLIAGMISYHENGGRLRPHNSMLVLDGKGEVAAYYDKRHLVPFGEYIPGRKYLPEFVRPVANAIGEFGQGSGIDVFKIKNYPRFSGAICYEIIFPHEVIDENNRPDVLINITNDGWYGNSAGPYQHWEAARFRAVEEGITVVRAANNGLSGMIDGYGRQKGVLALNYVGISDIKLEKSLPEQTVYGKYGNKIVIILCLILMMAGVINWSRTKL